MAYFGRSFMVGSSCFHPVLPKSTILRTAWECTSALRGGPLVLGASGRGACRSALFCHQFHHARDVAVGFALRRKNPKGKAKRKKKLDCRLRLPTHPAKCDRKRGPARLSASLGLCVCCDLCLSTLVTRVCLWPSSDSVGGRGQTSPRHLFAGFCKGEGWGKAGSHAERD